MSLPRSNIRSFCEEYEFFTTPTGCITIVKGGEYTTLEQTHHEFINLFLDEISTFYPEAYQVLCEEYKNSKKNKVYYEFLIVRRFLKCNFGILDNKPDISSSGAFCCEFVPCPMHGECKYEKIICNAKFCSTLTPRELEVMDLLCKFHTVEVIAERLYIAIDTVKNHRKNALKRLNLNSTISFLDYAQMNNLFKD